jgi:hypothetical protein
LTEVKVSVPAWRIEIVELALSHYLPVSIVPGKVSLILKRRRGVEVSS